MKKHLAKGFITALLVAVLMAVFAVSASAAENREWTAGGDNSFTFTEDTVVTVNGIVEITEQITIPDGISVTFQGNGGGDDAIKAADSFVSGVMIKTDRGTIIISNLTVDGNLYKYNDETEKYELRSGAVGPQLKLVNIVYSASNLYLKDGAVLTGAYTGSSDGGSGAAVSGGGNLYMSGNATIRGNYSANSGIVLLTNTEKHYIELNDTASISNNTVASWGGAIRANTNTVVTLQGNSSISYNTAGTGGGIYSDGTVKMLGNATIAHNHARSNGGGIQVESGTLTMDENSGITHNTTAGVGGGIRITPYADTDQGTVTVKGNAYISNNTATTQGGGIRLGNRAILNLQGNASVYNNSLTGTTQGEDKQNGGAGIHSWGSNSQINISENAKIYSNDAIIGGGGIHMLTGVLTIDGGDIYDNTTEDMGGGIWIASTLNLNKGNIYGNSAINGGGIYKRGGTVTISGGVIGGDTAEKANTASACGGGIYSWGGSTLTITGTAVIKGNTASQGGGLAEEQSNNVVISGGAITGNTATIGGGIYTSFNSADKSLTISGTAEVSGNNATSNSTGGGGIYVAAGGDSTPTVINITGGTISGNTSAHDGGGIYQNGGTINISGGVIGGDETGDANKAARHGGGVYVYSGNTTNGALHISGTAQIKGNDAAKNGGGISFSAAAGATMTAGTISGNTAGGSGGGISTSYGPFDISGGTISGNTANIGGGINVDYKCITSISGGTVTDNTATTLAGGIYVRDYSDCGLTASGTANVTGNWLGEDENTRVECNVQFDDVMNYPARITVADAHTGEIGIYFNAIQIDAGANVVIGTVENEATYNITSDNEGTFADNKATTENGQMVFAAANTKTITVKNAVDSSTVKTYTVPVYGKYALVGNIAEPAGVAETSQLMAYVLKTDLDNQGKVTATTAKKSTITAAELDDTVYTVWVDVVTEQGASVKLASTDGKSGIRFLTKVNVESLEAMGFTVTPGIMVGTDVGTDGILDYQDTGVVSALINNCQWKGGAYYGQNNTGSISLGTGYKAYSVGLNIDSANVETAYYFRGYVKVQLGEENAYTVNSAFDAEGNCRSAKQVAGLYCDWLNSESKTINEELVSNLEALSGYNYSEGTWVAPEAAE